MYTLYGDGVHDDTNAIQEMLDSGICEVALPAPESFYCISQTLRVHSRQTLRLLETAEIRLLPNSSFLCEENDVTNTNTEFVWIIDPIDGTTNFARGLYECAISVGLIKNGVSVLGVVYAPRMNLLFSATKGGGAFFGKVGSFEEGYEFDAIVLDDSVLPHPQSLNLTERMERAVYLGLDGKKITAKYVAGRKIL